MFPMWDAVKIAAQHSPLTGLVAGFALTALFLLVDKVGQQSDDPRRSTVEQSMLLLFAAFITGTLSSFMYATLVGDPTARAQFKFVFPSAVFALQIFLLLSGISMTFVVFSGTGISAVSSNICRLVICFSVHRMLTDLMQIFGLTDNETLILWLLGIVPLGIGVAVLVWYQGVKGSPFPLDISREAPRRYTRLVKTSVYLSIFVAFIFGFMDGYFNTIRDLHVWATPGLAYFIGVAVSGLGATMMVMVPGPLLPWHLVHTAKGTATATNRLRNTKRRR